MEFRQRAPGSSLGSPLVRPSPVRQTPDYYSNSIVTQNPFTVLAEFPALPYSSVVKASSNLSTPQKAETSKTPVKSYYSKPHLEHITLTKFMVSPDLKTLQDILSRYFPDGCQWYSDNPLKTQKFYEFILVDTNSVEITHNRDCFDSNKISFSKCIIKRVLRSEEWTQPFSHRSFSRSFNPPSYSYPDYKQAWFKTFLLRPFDHSWFFTFHSEFLAKNVPVWFWEWWTQFGPLPAIFPTDIQEAHNYYISKAPGELYRKNVQFHADFKVPWILCWSFAFNQSFDPPLPISIVREFKIKWWQNYSAKFCNIHVVKHFLTTGEKPKWEKPKIQAAPPTPTPAISTKEKKKVPQAPLTQKQIKIFEMFEDDPDMARAYLQFIRSSKEAASSEESTSKPIEEDLQDAQDPYDL